MRLLSFDDFNEFCMYRHGNMLCEWSHAHRRTEAPCREQWPDAMPGDAYRACPYTTYPEGVEKPL